jgi:6-phosphofructokinase
LSTVRGKNVLSLTKYGVGMKRIGILTGGGDVPGLNAVIKTVVQRCVEDRIRVTGILRGWQGIVEVDPDEESSRNAYTVPLRLETVRTVDRTGGTILHSSRTNPGHIKEKALPEGLDAAAFPRDDKGYYDLTARVLENLQRLEIDALVVTGGDDTLGYAARLGREGFPVVGVPKTMDNDVSGTEYCIGFSTAITRSVDMISDLRTPAGSHERIAVIELFGRNSGATALYAGYLSGADRVLISEVDFDLEKVCAMLVADQDESPSRYAVAVISEGAKPIGGAIMERGEPDPYGHRKLGGIGEWLALQIEARSGRQCLNQRLAYLMRSGHPDSVDRMVGINFGHLAYDLLRDGRHSRMTALQRGAYTTVPLSSVEAGSRSVDVEAYYDAHEYRPRVKRIEGLPLFLS